MNDANGKAKTALEEARANLEKTAEELRKAHPEVEKQAGALRDKLQAAVQNTVQVFVPPLTPLLPSPHFDSHLAHASCSLCRRPRSWPRR